MPIPSFNRQTTVFKFNERYAPDQGEANTYHQILKEAVWKHGTDVIFVPRVLVGVEQIFGEYLAPVLSKGHPFRMFVDEVENWNGTGDMYSRFGLKVQDSMTCWLPIDSFREQNPDGSDGELLYPQHNDLIYHVPSKKLFEITHVENESHPSFYLFGNMRCYKFTTTLYSFSHEEVVDDPSLPEGLFDLSQRVEGQEFDRSNRRYQDRTVFEETLDTTEKNPIFE